MNNELADRLTAVLMARPDLHDQDYWVEEDITVGEMLRQLDGGCGTTACAAGWTAVLTAPEDAVLGFAFIHFSDGSRKIIPDYAMEKLEISREQASALFLGASTRDEVILLLKHLKDHPVATAAELDVILYGKEEK